MINKLKIFTLIGILLPGLSMADIITTGDCNTSNASLTRVETSTLDIDPLDSNNNTGGPSGTNLLIGGPYSASECIGIFQGNDSNQVDDNIGEFEDGLLNGEGDILTGYEFIDGMVDGAVNPWYDGDPINIDGLGPADDPGWINLARYDVGEGITYQETLGLYIGDVLELTFSCIYNGDECSTLNWTLTTDKDIVSTVQDVLGRSTFDHLAFVTKAGNGKPNGNQADKGWAIYDFNFYEIFGKETFLGNTNFDTPEETFGTAYSLSGTINVKPGDFSAGLSHVTVWARDPLTITTDVPEPSTLGILGLSLLALRLRKLKS